MLAEVVYLLISVASWSLNEVAREVSLGATGVVDLVGKGVSQGEIGLNVPQLIVCCKIICTHTKDAGLSK